MLSTDYDNRNPTKKKNAFDSMQKSSSNTKTKTCSSGLSECNAKSNLVLEEDNSTIKSNIKSANNSNKKNNDNNHDSSKNKAKNNQAASLEEKSSSFTASARILSEKSINNRINAPPLNDVDCERNDFEFEKSNDLYSSLIT